LTSTSTKEKAIMTDTMRPQEGEPPGRGLYVASAVVDDAHPNRAEPVILEWDGKWLCPLHHAHCKWKVFAWIGPLAFPKAIGSKDCEVIPDDAYDDVDKWNEPWRKVNDILKVDILDAFPNCRPILVDWLRQAIDEIEQGDF